MSSGPFLNTLEQRWSATASRNYECNSRFPSKLGLKLHKPERESNIKLETIIASRGNAVVSTFRDAADNASIQVDPAQIDELQGWEMCEIVATRRGGKNIHDSISNQATPSLLPTYCNISEKTEQSGEVMLMP